MLSSPTHVAPALAQSIHEKGPAYTGKKTESFFLSSRPRIIFSSYSLISAQHSTEWESPHVSSHGSPNVAIAVVK